MLRAPNDLRLTRAHAGDNARAGVSDAWVANFARANANATASFRCHGQQTAALLLGLEYAAKSSQTVCRACDWPAPAVVRWTIRPNSTNKETLA